jgi:predicted aspartyl protease
MLLLLVTALAIVASASAAEPAMTPPAQKDPDLLAEFSTGKGRRFIILPVTIKGQAYSFILDTGSTITILDKSLRNSLEEPQDKDTIHTSAGPLTMDLFSPPEALVGPLDLQAGGQVGCMDFSGLRAAVGLNTRGILGMSFLKRYIIRIDFDTGVVQFRRWDGRNHTDWGNVIDLHSVMGDNGGSDDVPYAKATIPGAGEITFMVDTGSSDSVSLTSKLFAKAKGEMPTIATLSYTALGVGTNAHKLTRIASLHIGVSDLRSLVLDEANHNTLGLRFLYRYIGIFVEFSGWVRAEPERALRVKKWGRA